MNIVVESNNAEPWKASRAWWGWLHFLLKFPQICDLANFSCFRGWTTACICPMNSCWEQQFCSQIVTIEHVCFIMLCVIIAEQSMIRHRVAGHVQRRHWADFRKWPKMGRIPKPANRAARHDVIRQTWMTWMTWYPKGTAGATRVFGPSEKTHGIGSGLVSLWTFTKGCFLALVGHYNFHSVCSLSFHGGVLQNRLSLPSLKPPKNTGLLFFLVVNQCKAKPNRAIPQKASITFWPPFWGTCGKQTRKKRFWYTTIVLPTSSFICRFCLESGLAKQTRFVNRPYHWTCPAPKRQRLLRLPS